MKPSRPSQLPAAGQAAHTPTLELDEKSGCLFICRGGARIFLASITGEFSPNQNDLGALYWSDLEADSNGAARRLVAQLIRACNSHAALVAALESLTAALSTPDANKDCDRARLELLNLCPEYVGFIMQARAALAQAKQPTP